ncbi:nitroreductase family protein [Verrucomicrobiota bacterium]
MGDFKSLITKRYSCRSYKKDPVPQEHIDLILEAGQTAPSACNKKPWRFEAVKDESQRKRIVEEGFLPGFSMRWALNAPVLIVLGIERSVITHRVAPKISGIDYALIDIGIAGEHIVLQATELELGTCWIGWIRPGQVRNIIGWPKSIEPQAIISVGSCNDQAKETRKKD